MKKAEQSLRISAELGPNWLVMEALGRTKDANQFIQTAEAHVAELLESEEAGEPCPEVFATSEDVLQVRT